MLSGSPLITFSALDTRLPQTLKQATMIMIDCCQLVIVVATSYQVANRSIELCTSQMTGKANPNGELDTYESRLRHDIS